MTWSWIASAYQMLVWHEKIDHPCYFDEWRTLFKVNYAKADDPAWADYALFLESVLGIGD